MQHIKLRNTHQSKKVKKTKNGLENQLNAQKKTSPKSWSKLFFLQISIVCLVEYSKTTVIAVLSPIPENIFHGTNT